MQREFKSTRYGVEFTVVVRVEGDEVTAVLNWRSGFGGGSRRESKPGTSDATGLFNHAPGFVLADALTEMGFDDGITETVRA